MRIAIIGAGVSGLTAAFLLHRQHEIVVYESEPDIGGHTATVDIELAGQHHAVDTGFIVFNDWTYPNFIALMDRLGIESKPTEMGFSVTTRHQNTGGADFEYCGSTIASLFADPKQLVNPRFQRMLLDIVRFNRRAKADLDAERVDPQHGIGEYLVSGRYGRYFHDYYLNPMASAIWSTPVSDVADFNALFFLRFYANHGLLNINHRPQWRVIRGGSREYLGPLTAGFRDALRTSAGIQSVRRDAHQVVISGNLGEEKFDEVIFACHSDQALALIESPTAEEQSILGAIPYRANSVVLHTDAGLLPRRKRAWTSWNYLIDGSESDQPVLTYNMNILQGIRSDESICVTVNGDAHIHPDRVIRRFEYHHPQFGGGSAAAQAARKTISGRNRTWYCGAYWANGFHEDGVASALPIARALGGNTLD